jgi:hypothetical protein
VHRLEERLGVEDASHTISSGCFHPPNRLSWRRGIDPMAGTRLSRSSQESALSSEIRTLVEASQTLGAAFFAGFSPHATCTRGSRNGPVQRSASDLYQCVVASGKA